MTQRLNAKERQMTIGIEQCVDDVIVTFEREGVLGGDIQMKWTLVIEQLS